MRAPARSPAVLAVVVLLMTVMVLALGGAVLVVKLRPAGTPATKVERDVSRWEAAVRANPRDDWARTGLGLSLQEAGRAAEARRAFEQAVRLNGRNWVALFQLGLLVKPSDPARATQLLTRAARYAPRTSRAGPLVALGDLYLAGGHPGSAKGAYRRAIADVPYLFDAHYGLARALEALGDRKGALAQYREAARYSPSDPRVATAIARLKGRT